MKPAVHPLTPSSSLTPSLVLSLLVGAALCALGGLPAALAQTGETPALLAPAPPDRTEIARQFVELSRRIQVLQQAGKSAEAIPLAREALALVEGVYGPDHPSVATALSTLAIVVGDAGDYQQSLQLFHRALAIREKRLPADELAIATSLNSLASVYRQLGRYTEALGMIERALAMREQRLGPEHLSVANSLQLLGTIQHALGQPGRALTSFQRALSIREKSLGPEHRDVATALDNLGGIHRALGQYALSLPYYQRSLAIREKVLGPEHPATGGSLNNLSLTLRSMGRFQEALPLLERSVQIVERVSGAEHPDVATALGNLAGLHQAMGQYTQALPVFERSLAIREKALGPDHPAVALTLSNLATLLRTMARYSDALPLLQRSVVIRERALGPDHPDVANSLMNLAGLYRTMGQSTQAMPLYVRALALRERAYGPDHPNVGGTLNSMAETERNLGRYARALPLYERSRRIAEAAFGPDHPSLAILLSNIAELNVSMGQTPQARVLLERSVAIAEKSLGPEHPELANYLTSLGNLYRAGGQPARALALLDRALAIRMKAHGPDHPAVGASLNSIAAVQARLGQYDLAIANYQRALAIAERAFGPDHPAIAINLNNLAGAYRAMNLPMQALPLLLRSLPIASRGQTPETLWRTYDWLRAIYAGMNQSETAIFWGKQAVNTVQGLRLGLADLDRGLQESFLGNKRHLYTQLADLLIDAGRLAEAEQVLGLLKQFEYSELVRRSEDRGERVDYAGRERELARRGQELADRGVRESIELAELERRARQSPLASADEERRQALLREAQHWRADFQRWLASVGASLPGGATQARDLQAQGLRLQRLVQTDPGAVGLHYVVTPERISIIVSTARGSFARYTSIDQRTLNRQIAALRQALDARGDVLPAAQALYRTLIEPIEGDLREAQAQTLVLSLTDVLRYLSFSVLHDGQGFLVERYALAHLAQAAPDPVQQTQATWQVAGMGLTRAMGKFKALPGVLDELQGIVRTRESPNGLLPGSITIDEGFGLRSFEQAVGQRRFPVVHVASHFEFRPGDEGNSFLLLGDGSHLSLGQIAVMDFAGVDLLTLSACDTASGGGVNENGAEVEGLAAAVQQQGARSVLASLWPVADAGTARLMQHFYATLAASGASGTSATIALPKKSRAQALREAQLLMLRADQAAQASVSGSPALRGATVEGASLPGRNAASGASPRGTSHPYYWAPFILSGYWR